MAMTPLPTKRDRWHAWLAFVFRTRAAALSVDLALVAARIVLAWIFIYYGAGKLFGAFNGPGIHRDRALLLEHRSSPSGGTVRGPRRIDRARWRDLLGLGFGVRLGGLALFGDMVMAMITVTWATGINSSTSPPGYQLNMALGVLSLVIAVAGAGRFSVDALVEGAWRRWNDLHLMRAAMHRLDGSGISAARGRPGARS